MQVWHRLLASPPHIVGAVLAPQVPHRSGSETWVTVRTYDMGDTLAPNGLSTGCRVFCSRSI